VPLPAGLSPPPPPQATKNDADTAAIKKLLNFIVNSLKVKNDGLGYFYDRRAIGAGCPTMKKIQAEVHHASCTAGASD